MFVCVQFKRKYPHQHQRLYSFDMLILLVLSESQKILLEDKAFLLSNYHF